MLEITVAAAAFGAWTLTCIVAGYGLRMFQVDYRVIRTIAERSVDTRDEHMQAQTKQWQEAAQTLTKAKAEFERERADLAKAKGMSA